MDPDGKDKTKPDDKEQRVDVQPSEQTKEIKTTDICHNRNPSLEDAKTQVCDGIGNVKDSKWEQLPDNKKDKFVDATTKVANVSWKQLRGGIRAKLEEAVEKLEKMNWEGVPEAAKKYIQDHPCLTTFQITMLLFTLCPALFAGPMLGAMGFSSLGPVAGKQSQLQLPADPVHKLSSI